MASLSMGVRGSSLRSFSSLSFHSIGLARSLTALSFHEPDQASHIQRVHLYFTIARCELIKPRPSLSFFSSFCSSASACGSASYSALTAEINEQENEEEYEERDEQESEEESEHVHDQEVEETAAEPEDSDDRHSEQGSLLSKPRSLIRKFSPLSPKEKKDLRAYAHSLGKKIVSQQIGKAGVTEALAKAIGDTMEAKEIVKLKVLSNCPDELDEVIVKIEQATQGQVVGKIGNVVTLYRPSLRKQMKEAQKLKLQNRLAQGRPRRMGGSG